MASNSESTTTSFRVDLDAEHKAKLLTLSRYLFMPQTEIVRRAISEYYARYNTVREFRTG